MPLRSNMAAILLNGIAKGSANSPAGRLGLANFATMAAYEQKMMHELKLWRQKMLLRPGYFNKLSKSRFKRYKQGDY